MNKVGFTCGTYDLFHAGHVEALRQAALQCDRLIVGLLVDPTIDRPEKNKPIQSLFERLIQLNACRWVTEVVPYQKEVDIPLLINACNADVRFMGDEYKDHPGKISYPDLIPIIFTKRVGPSSSDIRERVKNS